MMAGIKELVPLISKVAVRFGGGGHVRASGFRRNGLTLDQVRVQLLPVLIKQLDC